MLRPPTNYAGSKDKLMTQLLKYFPHPDVVDRFYDVFAGGLSVTINSPYKSVISNDIIVPLIKFYSNLKKAADEDKVNEEIEKILYHKVDKESKEDFLMLKKSVINTLVFTAIATSPFYTSAQTILTEQQLLNRVYFFL